MPAEAGRRRFRPRFWPTLATLLGLVLLLGLGTWQLQRLAWKTDLIAAAEAGLAQPPQPLVGFAGPLQALDFRRIAVRGRYLHDAAFAFGVAAAAGRTGARLVTPLQLEDGRTLLVDRGWLPDDLLPPHVPAGLEPQGTIERTGVARYRAGVHRPWFAPADRPDARRWFIWDLAAMERTLGFPLLPIVLVLEESEGPAGLPRAERVGVDFRNDHLGYALTWYGLAAALLAVYLVFSFSNPAEPKP
jgi:surfeit locus 1 family protein